MTSLVRRPLAGVAVLALVALSACATDARQAAPEPPSTPAATASPSPSPAAPSPTPTPLPSVVEPTVTPRPAPRPTTSPRATPEPTPESTPEPVPAKPAALLAAGDRGTKVRELQHRLRQLDWFSGAITGHYRAATIRAVRGFQGKRGLAASGEVDARTWAALQRRTRMPTKDEMHNRLTPGPALLQAGDSGDRVRDLQARLKQIAWYSGDVTGFYGTATTAAVRGFQGKRAIPTTGEVDQRTLDRLAAMTREPNHEAKHNVKPKPSAAGLDRRCRTGRAMCVSKANNSLVWVVDGKPQLRVDVRFGSDELPTREGSFSVGWKSRDHVSKLYKTPMPFAMFFSGGQAVHYSPDFAARGYSGASHGCVNVRDRGAIERLFETVRVGDKVIVHR